MEDLKLLSLSDLLDLLIEQTTYHTQLISKGGATGEQFRIGRETLKQLQEEIGLRRLAEKTDKTIFPSQDESLLEREAHSYPNKKPQRGAIPKINVD